MRFFTRSLAEPAIPHVSPACDEGIEAAYQEAEKEFSKACYDVRRYREANPEADVLMVINGKAFNRVNGGSLNPRLAELCSLRELARMKRNSLLNIRADLLRRAGKVR